MTVLAVSADDDAHLEGTSFKNQSFVAIGSEAAGFPNTGLFHFSGITLAQAQVLDSVVTTYYAQVNQSSNTVNVKIIGEDADNPSMVTSNADYTSRAKTTAETAWNAVAAMTAGSSYDSPDHKAVCQEILDRGGWSSGNSMNIFLPDNGSTNGIRRQISSVTGGSNPAASMAFTYTAGGGGGSSGGLTTLGVG